MAKITMTIEAIDSIDLADTISSLMYLSAFKSDNDLVGEDDTDAFDKMNKGVEDRLSTEDADKPKRTRRTKEQIAADDAAAEAAKQALTKAEPAKSADVFGDQIKEVAAEAKAEGAPTLDMIKTALTACMSARGALAAQTILKEHANGVGRVSEIDPAHYAAVYAALTA